MTQSYRSGMSPATFVAGSVGAWRIDSMTPISGANLGEAARLEVRPGIVSAPEAAWTLRATSGHVRYVERPEKTALDPLSPALGRPEAICGALIPIRKSDAWWALPQDERRAIFEARSRHIQDCLAYLPRIARRLYHARELGEPFDFVTWFEFAPEHAAAFDELLALLRSREEWQFVEREVELRLSR
ncbi:MAG TPA: chlorite dismutase family protein [Polyangiaceae bacterium]|nr:chlorite dismutase family protein [Polyangiaceae bacterium]